MQSYQLVNRQFGRLKRHRAKADEAIGMLRHDVGDVVVDHARGGDAEVGRRVVIGLVRRGGERLDVDPHHVHVGEPLLDRSELHARPLHLLPVYLARARIGEHFARPTIDGARCTEHCFGRFGQHVAMNVDGEMPAARMWRAREPTWNSCVRRQAGEQHLRAPHFHDTPDLRRAHSGKTHAVQRARLAGKIPAGHRACQRDQRIDRRRRYAGRRTQRRHRH